MNFYDYSARAMDNKETSMSSYKGKIVLVVNTASKCGFTPQFAELEKLYQDYKDKDLEILGFPCNQFANQDPQSNEEIQSFCQLNYGVSFTMFQKINVNGDDAHPLYKFLKEQAKGPLGSRIKWNFTKFIIDQEGNVLKRYAPNYSPLKIAKDIDKLL